MLKRLTWIFALAGLALGSGCITTRRMSIVSLPLSLAR
jgi:hypothetical protein